MSTTIAYTALVLVLGLPLFLTARRQQRPRLIRQFLIGAVAVGVFCGVMGASSAKLISDCETAGNPDCIDYGSTGLQVFSVGVYAAAAWIKAYLLAHD